MYQQYYDLKADPFRLTPDSLTCFKHPSYNHAKTYMQFALFKGEGVVVVTGQPGTGKSALIADLASTLSPKKTVLANLTSTQLENEDFLRMIAYEFRVKKIPEGETNIIKKIELSLAGIRNFGRCPLLIVDEAQNLHHSALETLQKLAKLKWREQPLVQIFLVGQELLHEKLLDARLEFLHQHINAVIRLEPLNEESAKQYIQHRLLYAGWSNNPRLSEDIYHHIYRYSRGIPRWINLICSRMLLHGMTENLLEINTQEILRTIKSLTSDSLLPEPLQSSRDVLI